MVLIISIEANNHKNSGNHRYFGGTKSINLYFAGQNDFPFILYLFFFVIDNADKLHSKNTMYD